MTSVLDSVYGKIIGELEKIEGIMAEEGRIDPVRKISQTLDIMEGAENGLEIVGINCLGPIHQGRESLTRLVGQEGYVRIFLLDPEAPEFADRAMAEGDFSKRIASELAASLAGINDVLRHEKPIANPESLRVFLHRYPKAAIVGSDVHDPENANIQFNVYPADRRGLKGKTYRIIGSDGDAYTRTSDFLGHLMLHSTELKVSRLDAYADSLHIALADLPHLGVNKTTIYLK